MRPFSKTFVLFLAVVGLVLLGYGLRMSNFSFSGVLRLMTQVVWPLGVFLVLGLLLLLWSLGQARSKETGKPSWHAVMGLLGVCYLGLTVGSLAMNWKGLLQRFSGDQADAARMAYLAEAKLESAQVSVTPGDWPQWRGPLRDGKSTETGINTDWHTTPPKTLWRHTIGGGYSSISVVGDRLYTMDRQHDQERIVCLGAEDGKEVWSHRYPINFSRISYDAGPRATPTIVGKHIYSVGATGICIALEMPGVPGGQPKEVWRHDLPVEFNASMPTWGIACSPLVEGDLVIVQPGGSKGSVAAFHRLTGKQVWSALSDPNGYSSPMVADLAGERQVVALTGMGVAGLALNDGRKLWYFDWLEQYLGNIATPIVAGNFVFISSAYDSGGCALLEISGGNSQFEANPVYVKRKKLMQNHHSTSILHHGCLYGFDKEIFKCVDLRTATEKWASRKPYKGSLTYADGHLIILTERGELNLVKASPEECKIVGKVDLFDRAETWAVPVLSRGRLYVRDKAEIVCLELRAGAKQ